MKSLMPLRMQDREFFLKRDKNIHIFSPVRFPYSTFCINILITESVLKVSKNQTPAENVRLGNLGHSWIKFQCFLTRESIVILFLDV